MAETTSELTEAQKEVLTRAAGDHAGVVFEPSDVAPRLVEMGMLTTTNASPRYWRITRQGRATIAVRGVEQCQRHIRDLVKLREADNG